MHDSQLHARLAAACATRSCAAPQARHASRRRCFRPPACPCNDLGKLLSRRLLDLPIEGLLQRLCQLWGAVDQPLVDDQAGARCCPRLTPRQTGRGTVGDEAGERQPW